MYIYIYFKTIILNKPKAQQTSSGFRENSILVIKRSKAIPIAGRGGL
jgi:hypothetical protein